MAVCAVDVLAQSLSSEEEFSSSIETNSTVLALSRARHESSRRRRNGRRHSKVTVIERRTHDHLSWNYLPVTLSSEEERIVAECAEYVLPHVRPKWTEKKLPTKHKIFEDGVSNTLVGFFRDRDVDESENESDDAVLVRVSGEGREMSIDSETEIIVMSTLHAAGLSPPLYLVTKNALCYGYIPGKALSSNDMQCDEVLRATARALAQFHSVEPPSCLRDDEPWVWAMLEKWMGLLDAAGFQEMIASQRFKQVFGTLEELKEEQQWLKSLLGSGGGGGEGRLITSYNESGSKMKRRSSCVLCHNDPQPLNFVRTPSGEVVLIDMEYSGMNYPAFDVGDFFCEFAGVHGTLDYSRYPCEEVQKRWITYYLKEYAQLNGNDPERVTSDEIDTLYRDANHFALMAHFLWSLWSLLQTKYSKIQFDYFEYGRARYAEYKSRKATITLTSHH